MASGRLRKLRPVFLFLPFYITSRGFFLCFM